MICTSQGKAWPAVMKGEFRIAAMRLDHGHIYRMCHGLTEAGAEVSLIDDPDPANVQVFQTRFPKARLAGSEAQVLENRQIRLVAAAIPNERGPLGRRVMAAGKDYFTDKTPFTQM